MKSKYLCKRSCYGGEGAKAGFIYTLQRVIEDGKGKYIIEETNHAIPSSRFSYFFYARKVIGIGGECFSEIKK